ncbi:hypothetical protein I7I48_03851 [Histoplasma ohiense]|nr:hypothetical protein I7I48_03851 [Histoplasma ohiense (nom. inval.)]
MGHQHEAVQAPGRLGVLYAGCDHTIRPPAHQSPPFLSFLSSFSLHCSSSNLNLPPPSSSPTTSILSHSLSTSPPHHGLRSSRIGVFT